MRVLRITFLIVVLDQITKIWVKTSMVKYQSIPVLGDVFKFTFTENPGMAFGLSLGSKLFLTLFSIIATGLIGLYLWNVRTGPKGYRIALSLILGGALGNIIDRVFYGVIWGYGELFYGNVVDFIHIDLWQGLLPGWLPFVGGSPFALFPIGNIADLAIIGGVGAIIIFQRRFQDAMIAAESASSDASSTPIPDGSATVAASSSAETPQSATPPDGDESHALKLDGMASTPAAIEPPSGAEPPHPA